MKFALILLAIVTLIPGVNAKASPPGPQQPAEQQPPPGAGATSEAPRQEKAEAPQAPEAPAVEAQRMEPAQVSDLLHRVYNAAYRISDLLSALQSEKWDPGWEEPVKFRMCSCPIGRRELSRHPSWRVVSLLPSRSSGSRIR